MDLHRCASPHSRSSATLSRAACSLAVLWFALPMFAWPAQGQRAAAAGAPSRPPTTLVTGDDPAIAQVVAAGRTLPRLPILAVRGAPATFVLRVVSGAARFEGDRAEVFVTVEAPGWLDQPAIRPGPLGDQSVIEVRAADGTFAADSRAVFTATHANIAKLRRLVAPSDPACLDAGAHHVVIDLRAVRDHQAVTVFGAGVARRSPALGADVADVGAAAIGAAAIGMAAIDAAVLGAADFGRADDGATAKGATDMTDRRYEPDVSSPPGGAFDPCLRPAEGPGQVYWAFDNAADAGYAVKPDGGADLVWARARSQGVDGIYRRDWGCCTAFKIPNSCTVTVLGPDGSFEAHCNLVAWLSGKRLGWFDACAHSDWPDCPLP